MTRLCDAAKDGSHSSAMSLRRCSIVRVPIANLTRRRSMRSSGLGLRGRGRLLMILLKLNVVWSSPESGGVMVGVL